MHKSVPDLFKEIGQSKDKVAKLREVAQAWPGIKTYFAVAFDPKWEWDLPEGVPPLKGDRTLPYSMTGSTLYKEARRMYIFGKQFTNVKRIKKESLYVNMLESLHQSEIDLLVAMKDGTIEELYGFGEDDIRAAFPGYLSPAVEKKTKKKQALSKG